MQKEALKDDLDEADIKVEQCRDVLAGEMFSLLRKENEISQYILQLLKLQRGYHESALENLEKMIPILEKKIGNFYIIWCYCTMVLFLYFNGNHQI